MHTYMPRVQRSREHGRVAQQCCVGVCAGVCLYGDMLDAEPHRYQYTGTSLYGRGLNLGEVMMASVLGGRARDDGEDVGVMNGASQGCMEGV